MKLKSAEWNQVSRQNAIHALEETKEYQAWIGDWKAAWHFNNQQQGIQIPRTINNTKSIHQCCKW